MTTQQPAQQPPSKQEAELYDIQADVKAWALNTFYQVATKKQRKLNANQLDLRLIWDDIVVTHSDPEYSDNRVAAVPKSHSLFSTTFRNNTDSEQEYSFRTERCTRSVAEIELSRGLVTSRELGLKLTLPNNVLEANAGFHRELSLNSSTRQSTEEELSWGVDTRIPVPPKRCAFAEVKVKEEQITSAFRFVTTLHGRMRAVFYYKQNFICCVEGDLGTVIESELRSRTPRKDGSRPHVWVEPRKNAPGKMVLIETSGRCLFRFGVHQEVEVSERQLS